MALNLKNPEVELLAAEVARLAGESKTEAIRKALLDRKARLEAGIGQSRSKAGLIEFLERSVWPKVHADALGRGVSRQEEDEALGYGPSGF